MTLRPATEEEWRAIQMSGDGIESVRNQVKKLLGLLGDCFNDKTPGGVGGLTFSQFEEGEVTVAVGNPYAKARFRFSLRFAGTPIAILELQREKFDQIDRLCWENVQQVVVRSTGVAYVGDPSKEFSLNAYRWEDLIFTLGMQILYAIAAGPIED